MVYKLLSEGNIIHGIYLSHSLPELVSRLKLNFVYLSLFLRHVPNTNPQNIVNVTCKTNAGFSWTDECVKR